MFQVLKGLVAAGMCGRKSDKGMFVYAKGQKDRPVNQEGLNIIKKFATVAPAATSGDDDIALRLVTRYDKYEYDLWLVQIRFVAITNKICTGAAQIPARLRQLGVVAGGSYSRFYY
jgi:hypothetical protein